MRYAERCGIEGREKEKGVKVLCRSSMQSEVDGRKGVRSDGQTLRGRKESRSRKMCERYQLGACISRILSHLSFYPSRIARLNA